MPSSTDKIKQTFAIKPCQKLRGKIINVVDVVHLPDVRRIITCSYNHSLLLWDLESGEQIGDEWRDDGDQSRMWRITLSPNGKRVASASEDGTVRLWDVETKKVVARWTGKSTVVSVCWSADGERVLTGYLNGMVSVRNIGSGNTILGPIKTGHKKLYVATYFHDKMKIVTGGEDENAIKIWDSTTGKLLTTVEHDSAVWCLAWTSNQKKLISGSTKGLIKIFDAVTWQQIAVLAGHDSDDSDDYKGEVGVALFQNDRLLASICKHQIHLWDLDTNLPVGPPIQNEQISRAAISADGKLLVTFSWDTRINYVWDIDTILKDPGLKSFLSISKVLRDTLETLRAAKSLSVLNVTSTSAATRRPVKPERVPRLPQGFFNDVRDGVQSSTIPVAHVQPSRSRHWGFTPSLELRPHALFNQLSSLFRRSHPNTSEATALQQLPRQSRHRPFVEVATAQDKQTLYVAPRPQRPGDKGKQTQQQQGQSQSQAQASTPQTPPAATTTSTISPQITTVGAAATQSQPATTVIQQQGQVQMSQTPPAVTSTSTTSPQVTAAGPATQSKPVTWRTRLVFFVCCASIDQYR